MSTRKVKDAKDLESNELIYFKSHAKATYMSDGRTVEEAVNSMNTGDLSQYATKTDLEGKMDKVTLAPVATSGSYNDLSNKPTIPTDYLGCENVGEELEEVVEYLTTSSQTLSDAEKERVKSNIGVNVPIVEHGTSDQTFALTSNKYHRWGAMTSLTLTLASPNDTSVVNNYAFEFTSGETPTTLLVPSNIQWVNDVNIEANMRYQGNINSGIGVLVSVSNE